jgi:hypothetical protein
MLSPRKAVLMTLLILAEFSQAQGAQYKTGEIIVQYKREYLGHVQR